MTSDEAVFYTPAVDAAAIDAAWAVDGNEDEQRQRAEEEADLGDILGWLDDRFTDITAMPCLLLENLIRGLIHGGRRLYAWNNGAGGYAPAGTGLAEVLHLDECVILPYVSRYDPPGKNGPVVFSLKVPDMGLFVGRDETLGLRSPQTIGPRGVGAPPDILLRVGPNWLRELDDREKEFMITSALLRIVPSSSAQRPWSVAGPDISLDSAALALYGGVTSMATLAIQSAQRHVPQRMPELTQEDKAALIETYAREAGRHFYRPSDGAIVAPDGTVLYYVTRDENGEK